MEKIVCFIGHRKVEDVSLVRKKVSILVYRLLDQDIYCFPFGDHSDFDQICWEEITKIKEIEKMQVCFNLKVERHWLLIMRKRKEKRS